MAGVEGATYWKGLLENPRDLQPHVVILGAGASRAAFPSGDSSGQALPLMNDLVEVAGLRPILKAAGVRWRKGMNFERLFSSLHSCDPTAPLLRDLEEAIRRYFRSLSLPSHPTLYDHLLLSLRPNDLIATFNWDPLLVDCYLRVKERQFQLPGISLLHGNVRVAYCPAHRRKGAPGARCPECTGQFIPTTLLYPVAEKDYADRFIDREWELLRLALRNAFTLTIFGYGAPATDKKAVALMRDAWSGQRERQFEQTQVIERPGRDKYEVWRRWRPFIYSGHFDYATDFYESSIGAYPRRSCEAIYERTVMGRFVPETHPIPRDLDWPGLVHWIEPLIAEEKKVLDGGGVGAC